MAPEMLEGTGHSYSLDIYSFGSLAYELLTGAPPHFNSPNEDLQRLELYRRILNDEVKIP